MISVFLEFCFVCASAFSPSIYMRMWLFTSWTLMCDYLLSFWANPDFVYKISVKPDDCGRRDTTSNGSSYVQLPELSHAHVSVFVDQFDSMMNSPTAQLFSSHRQICNRHENEGKRKWKTTINRFHLDTDKWRLIVTWSRWFDCA